MGNSTWFQLLNFKDLLFFLILYDMIVNQINKIWVLDYGLNKKTFKDKIKSIVNYLYNHVNYWSFVFGSPFFFFFFTNYR